MLSNLKSQSVGGTTSGGQTYCDSINSGFISLTGQTGNIVTWQVSTNGGLTWADNGNTFTTQSYFNLKQTNCFRAIVKNGAFANDTSTIACITVFLKSKGGIVGGGGNFCTSPANTTLNLTNYLGNVLKWESSENAGTSWTTIPSTANSLAVSNLTVNTMYRAIVKNGSMCASDTSNIALVNIVSASFGGSLSIIQPSVVCYGVNTTSISLTGQNGTIINWARSINNGASWSPIVNTSANYVAQNLTQNSIFSVIVQNLTCPKDSSNKIRINVSSPITVNAGNDTTIIQTDTIRLNGISSGGTLLWTPNLNISNTTTNTPTVYPINTTSYVLTVSASSLCERSDTVVVTVLPLKFEENIANIITPNGDGINDTWYIDKIKYFKNNQVFIYNIYGQLIYQKTNYNNEWDATYNGNILNDGTYYYVLKLVDLDLIYKGSVDIIKSR